MGGKHSVKSILITADQASSTPGSNITDKIYMKFEKPVRASTLWLKFKGAFSNCFYLKRKRILLLIKYDIKILHN
ncbi:unnamed protein product [Blepharisma stoltei]|uniref:SbsA Ig-like domain-containing protein n=1 Tax=Blepharisma stoltei TaxID=1481888 RepID=A0AAU9KBC4_9CILI|nr:unnamed protein product [Blepharisma stoltei]